MENKCICCGEPIPEDRRVCSDCAVTSVDKLMRENDDLIAALQERDMTIAMLKDTHASEIAYRKWAAATEKREMAEAIFDDIVMCGDSRGLICLSKSDFEAIKRRWLG